MHARLVAARQLAHGGTLSTPKYPALVLAAAFSNNWFAIENTSPVYLK